MPPTGRVAFWNYEMSESQFRVWLRKQGIAKTDRGAILNLRGYSIPIWIPYVKDWAVEWLTVRGSTCWILDPYARAFSGCGPENSNEDSSRFLDAIDEIKQRAGIDDFIMSAHTGRMEQEEGKERARGATRLDDWADARWVLVKQNGVRYFRADGRDVDVSEKKLGFDPETKHLKVVGEDRRTERVIDAAEEVVDVVEETPGINKRVLLSRLQGKTETKYSSTWLGLGSRILGGTAVFGRSGSTLL